MVPTPSPCSAPFSLEPEPPRGCPGWPAPYLTWGQPGCPAPGTALLSLGPCPPWEGVRGAGGGQPLLVSRCVQQHSSAPRGSLRPGLLAGLFFPPRQLRPWLSTWALQEGPWLWAVRGPLSGPPSCCAVCCACPALGTLCGRRAGGKVVTWQSLPLPLPVPLHSLPFPASSPPAIPDQWAQARVGAHLEDRLGGLQGLRPGDWRAGGQWGLREVGRPQQWWQREG